MSKANKYRLSDLKRLSQAKAKAQRLRQTRPQKPANQVGIVAKNQTLGKTCAARSQKKIAQQALDTVKKSAVNKASINTKRQVVAQQAISKKTTKKHASNGHLTETERRLFREAMATVEPLAISPRVSSKRVHKAAYFHNRRLAASETPDNNATSGFFDGALNCAEQNDAYLKTGHGPDLLNGLRRNRWPIQASLDLHGYTRDRAHQRLVQFLHECTQYQLRCIRIVHGKGYGSKGGQPVLKAAVRRWLAQKPFVMAFSDCADFEGGTGAVKVLLNKQ
ncbi:MAG TPA: Smr/MutS family protein [Burkholderiaceae bacterium]|nr:Smr/MutS family protein [Burkholderiaceae bacterium]